MKRIQQSRARSAAASFGWLKHALVLLTLFAFTAQSYLVQTHIHLPTTDRAIVDLLDGPVTPADHNKAPAKDDPANCPLCQQSAMAGQFLTPAAAAILLPSLSYSVIVVATPASTLFAAVTHIWRGRGPPRR
jgi:hypothetical protein